MVVYDPKASYEKVTETVYAELCAPYVHVGTLVRHCSGKLGVLIGIAGQLALVCVIGKMVPYIDKWKWSNTSIDPLPAHIRCFWTSKRGKETVLIGQPIQCLHGIFFLVRIGEQSSHKKELLGVDATGRICKLDAYDTISNVHITDPRWTLQANRSGPYSVLTLPGLKDGKVVQDLSAKRKHSEMS